MFNKEKDIEKTILTIYDKIRDSKIEELKKEIKELTAKKEALEQDKIYSKNIIDYEILENKTVYFSQDELETYLRCMYNNIQKEKYSIGINKIIEKTQLNKDIVKAIRLKLIDDGIIEVSGMKTIIKKYLLNDVDEDENCINNPNEIIDINELPKNK